MSELVNSQPYAIKWKIRRKFDVPSTIPQTDHHKLASLEAGYSHSIQQLDFEASDPPLGKRVEFSVFPSDEVTITGLGQFFRKEGSSEYEN